MDKDNLTEEMFEKIEDLYFDYADRSMLVDIAGLELSTITSDQYLTFDKIYAHLGYEEELHYELQVLNIFGTSDLIEFTLKEINEGIVD